MTTVLITGGTGLIGKALTVELVEKGYDVIVLTRNTSNRKSPLEKVSYAQWDVEKQTIDEAAIQKADHIIHLAGAGVADERWTEKRKEEIKNSRVNSGKLLVKALQQTPNKVQTVLSASAIGWYGEDKALPKGKAAFTEEMPADNSFLGETCKLWEDSIRPVEGLGKRLVIVRTGIVLSNDGGAFKEFKSPVKFGIGAVLGNGKQVISWIHISDMCRVYMEALEHTEYSGVYNAVAPNPVPNKVLTISLAEKLKGRYAIPIHVPQFVLKLMLGEMSVEVLKSTTVSADKLEKQGFLFLFPDIRSAINELCNH